MCHEFRAPSALSLYLQSRRPVRPDGAWKSFCCQWFEVKEGEVQLMYVNYHLWICMYTVYIYMIYSSLLSLETVSGFSVTGDLFVSDVLFAMRVTIVWNWRGHVTWNEWGDNRLLCSKVFFWSIKFDPVVNCVSMESCHLKDFYYKLVYFDSSWCCHLLPDLLDWSLWLKTFCDHGGSAK